MAHGLLHKVAIFHCLLKKGAPRRKWGPTSAASHAAHKQQMMETDRKAGIDRKEVRERMFGFSL
jgi:hypothetical protein